MVRVETASANSAKGVYNYKKELCIRRLKTGAVIGGVLCVANDIFQHKHIAANYMDDVAKFGKNKAIFKTARLLALNLAGAMAVYALINTAIGTILDKLFRYERV